MLIIRKLAPQLVIAASEKAADAGAGVGESIAVSEHANVRKLVTAANAMGGLGQEGIMSPYRKRKAQALRALRPANP